MAASLFNSGNRNQRTVHKFCSTNRCAAVTFSVIFTRLRMLKCNMIHIKLKQNKLNIFPHCCLVTLRRQTNTSYVVLPKISEKLNKTAQSICTTNLRRSVPLAASSNRQSADWRLYNCTCSLVLAVFLTPFSWVSAIIVMATVKKQRICIKFCFIKPTEC
jgi:hypothetical protein